MSELHFNEMDAQVIYDEILNALRNGVGEQLYPGDERYIFGEALAAVVVSVYNTVDDTAKQKMLRYARGEVLDALGERLNTPRLQPNKASATVRFSVSAPRPNNIVIPAGTRVTADSECYFETQLTAILPAKAEYVDLPVFSLEGGAQYNGYEAGRITTLVDLIPFIMTKVENLDTTHGGDDGEPYDYDGDSRYRERIQLAPETLSAAGTEGRYRYYALGVDPSIIDAKVLSPAPAEIKIIPLLSGGEIPDQDMLDKVYAVVNDKKVRAFTDLVSVEPPTAVEFEIDITYYTTDEDESAVVQTIEGPGGAIDRYIEWQSGEIGRDINPDKLRSFVLSPDWTEGLTGAVRVTVNKPDYKELSDVEVAKLSKPPVINHIVTAR